MLGTFDDSPCAKMSISITKRGFFPVNKLKIILNHSSINSCSNYAVGHFFFITFTSCIVVLKFNFFFLRCRTLHYYVRTLHKLLRNVLDLHD